MKPLSDNKNYNNNMTYNLKNVARYVLNFLTGKHINLCTFNLRPV